MTEMSDCRICLGGKLRDFGGYAPGVVEEAALTLADSKPAYLSGLMGGAASRIIDWIRSEPPHLSLLEPGPVAGDHESWFAGFGMNSLAVLCGLATDELDRLFRSQTLDSVFALVTVGLRRRTRGIRSPE